MNKIIKKLHIPGHETRIIIKPRKNKENKITSVQLSLNIDVESKKVGKDK